MSKTSSEGRIPLNSTATAVPPELNVPRKSLTLAASSLSLIGEPVPIRTVMTSASSCLQTSSSLSRSERAPGEGLGHSDQLGSAGILPRNGIHLGLSFAIQKLWKWLAVRSSCCSVLRSRRLENTLRGYLFLGPGSTPSLPHQRVSETYLQKSIPIPVTKDRGWRTRADSSSGLPAGHMLNGSPFSTLPQPRASSDSTAKYSRQ